MKKRMFSSGGAVWIAVLVAAWIMLLFVAVCALIRGGFWLKYTEASQEDGWAVSGYWLSSDTLTVPQMHKGLPVERVLKESFAGAPMKEVKLTSAAVIEESAFLGCGNMETLDLGQAETIGARAFAACGALNEVIIPASTEQIGDKAFYSCRFLSQVYFLGEPEVMGENIFGDIPAVQIYGPGGGPLQAYCEAHDLEFYVISQQMIEAIIGKA